MLNSLHALSHKSFSEENDPLKNQILTILKCLKNLKISPLLKTTRLVFQLSSNIPIFATSRSYDAMSTGNLINSDEVWSLWLAREEANSLPTTTSFLFEITFAFCGWRRKRWHNSNFLPTRSFVPFDFYFLSSYATKPSSCLVSFPVLFSTVKRPTDLGRHCCDFISPQRCFRRHCRSRINSSIPQTIATGYFSWFTFCYEIILPGYISESFLYFVLAVSFLLFNVSFVGENL